MLKHLTQRGVYMLLSKPAQLRMMDASKVSNIIDIQNRAFAKKRKSRKNAAGASESEYATEEESEPVAEATPAQPEPVQEKANWAEATAAQE